ncbi:hypothetical protein FLL46_00530 [Aliikangiella coralliicola]|uniref:Uncharacterized protein n=1 Tax=Aliikangiella coralliicola TaxID=2592383 RepID=A0A545UK82_9GAMM|nr:hypothetical protein FLL46_00530 [Aliikangiella coralliicola]
MLNITLKAFVIWLGILILAILNGVIREAILIPEIGKNAGFILSGILLSTCILLVTYFTLPWIGKRSVTTYIFIGIGWLCITLLFEFSFGLAQGNSWLQLFEAYTFKDGNIWPIVMIVIAVAPYLSAKIRS